jgi:uncharacterized membrane protein/GT2 family glycosyltransferase
MTSDRPLVSVIIPTYNSASTLERCLESVQAQTYPNVEILVVDNYSDDGTGEIAARMATVVQAGPERSAQVNVGALHARGAYLYRIDGDMVLDPAVVEACVEAIEAEGLDAVAVPNRSQGDGFWARVRTLERDTYLDDALIVAARFWKRSAFDAVGGFDETLVACEDYDLHNRLVAAGYRIGRVAPMEVHLGEARSLGVYAAQSFYYGPSVLRYVRKHPRRGVRQMVPLRPAYLRHWRMLVRKPLLLSGLVLLKLVQYTAAALGAAASALGLVAGRGRIALQAVAGLVLVLLSSWALAGALPAFGIRAGALGSWAVMGAGLAVWQLVGRRRARLQGASLSSTLLGVGLAFGPLLLILVAQPAPEVWRVLSGLALAACAGWLTYLAQPAADARSGRALPVAVLLVVVAAFVVLFSLVGLSLLHTFSLSPYDLAVVDQALWTGSHGGAGGALSTLLTSSIDGRSLLGYDAAPALLLLLPAYALGLGGPHLLLISQSLALGLGAIALYRLAAGQIGRVPAVLIAVAYLACFVTIRLAVGRFFPLTWSIPLLLLALDAYRRRHIVRYYILAVLALACGLDAAWAVAAWGAYLFLLRRDRTHGLITLLLGVAWLGVALGALVPFFGGTAGEVLGWAGPPEGEPFLPWAAGRLLRPEALRYMATLLAPTGFVPLLGAPLLLPALPRLVLTLLSESPSATSLGGRYEIILLPFLFAAAVGGLGWLAGRARERRWAPPQLAVGVLILVASVTTAAVFVPHVAAPLRRPADLAAVQVGHDIVRQISAQASVAAQSPFAIALAHRPQLTILPNAQDPDLLLFDAFHPNREPDPAGYQEALRRAFHNPAYGLRTLAYGYLLFERGLDPATKLDAIATFTVPEIEYARRVELTGTVAYLGFDVSSTRVQAGEIVYLTHYWQSLRPTPTPYLQFTAYPGSQRFEPIAFGLYPPDQWQPGVVVRHVQTFSLPLLPDGDAYEIAVGLWYDEGEPALRSPEQLLGNDVIRIATLSARGGQYEIHPWASQGGEDVP